MRSAWNGKNKNWHWLLPAVFLFVCVPGCDDAPRRPGEGFYEYTGFRDWWRIPLRFPYQITIVDDFQDGLLEKCDPDSRVSDPNSNTTVVQDRITEIGYHDKFSIFKQENKAASYGILIYASGEIKFFPGEDELKSFIRRKYPEIAVPEMMMLKKFYDLRWKTLGIP